MNLLEATTTMIDAVKTYAPEDDKTIQRAVKRFEKRLFVLQVRAAKRRRRNRRHAFQHAVEIFNGRAASVCGRYYGEVDCKGCNTILLFGDFCRDGEFSGSGKCIN